MLGVCGTTLALVGLVFYALLGSSVTWTVFCAALIISGAIMMAGDEIARAIKSKR